MGRSLIFNNISLTGVGFDSSIIRYTNDFTSETTSSINVLTFEQPKILSVGRNNLSAASIGSYALFGGGAGATISGVIDAFDNLLVRTLPTILRANALSLAAASNDNYALFGGGLTGSTTVTNIVTAYDALLVRNNAPNLSTARKDLEASSIGGQVLFAGGENADGSIRYSVVNSYNNSLVLGSPTSLNVSPFLFASASNTSFALFGGGFTNVYNTVVNAYNSSLVRSIPTGLSSGRYLLTGASTGNFALFSGGLGETAAAGRVIDAYNTSLVRSTPSIMSIRRDSHVGIKAPNNCAIFVGGNSSSTLIDVYDSNLVQYANKNISINRSSLAAATVENYALFGGGSGSSNVVDVIEVSNAPNYIITAPTLSNFTFEYEYSFNEIGSGTIQAGQNLIQTVPFTGILKFPKNIP